MTYDILYIHKHMGVSKNRGTPKSSNLIGFAHINHPFGVPLFLETPIYIHIDYIELCNI